MSRRRFLGAAAGAATLAGLPAKAAVPSTLVMRFQGAWPAKDVFHEYALDFASKINDMAAGDLRLEVLPAGAVVAAGGVLDAVSKGLVDGGHVFVGHHYAKHSAFALWSTGPAFGMDANMLLAWHKYGGGKELLEKLYNAIGANVVSFAYGPTPTQPLGWFKKPIARPEDLKGLKFHTVRMSAEIFTALGADVSAMPKEEIIPAMRGGALDGAEWNNVSSDRALGLPDVAKVCMLQSYHQNAEPFEVLFNKPKFEALSPQLKALVANAVEAASADMSWKAIDRYSQVYAELRRTKGVRFFKTPDSILRRQLTAYDSAAEKKAQEDPLFREIAESQRRFAERAVKWDLDTNVDRRMAYRHYFGKSARPAAKKN